MSAGWTLRAAAMAVVVAACGVQAQDMHFSQFFQTPHAQNPANIGAFDGTARFGGVFRQQWRAVTVPYRSFGLGADLRDAFGVEGLGAGAWIANDRAGDSRLNTFNASVGASWTRRFGPAKAHAISAGLYGGWTALNIDYAVLRFDNQYNGYRYDPGLATGEGFQRDAIGHPDLHAGGSYRFQPADRVAYTVGLALFNLTRPDVAFFEAAPSPLDRRTVLHAEARFPVALKLDLMPSVQWMGQATFRELNAGAALRYIMFQRYGYTRAVRGGLHMRAGDALYAHAALEHDDWTIGLSYDLNFSSLVPASRNRGGFEITAVHLLRKRAPVPIRNKACPEQL